MPRRAAACPPRRRGEAVPDAEGRAKVAGVLGLDPVAVAVGLDPVAVALALAHDGQAVPRGRTPARATSGLRARMVRSRGQGRMARMGPPDPEWERRRHELPTVSAKDTEEIRRYGLIGVVGGWWLAPLGLGATALDRLPFWPGGLMPDGVAEAAWLAAVAGAAGLVLGGVLLFAIDWAPADRPRAKRGLAAGAVAALLVWVLQR